jgi:hypothetical protein
MSICYGERLLFSMEWTHDTLDTAFPVGFEHCMASGNMQC